jgi:Flp pilus assembly protein TadB
LSGAERDDRKVQLGCGTLIIIALIVMVFSGSRDNRQLRRELDEMRKQLDRIEKKLDSGSAELPAR